MGMISSDLHIPAGTYPENRLIDGAIGGSVEDFDAMTNWTLEAGPEANLDFQASMPLIWPQKTVLFQTDDTFYEDTATTLLLNSKFPSRAFYL